MELTKRPWSVLPCARESPFSCCSAIRRDGLHQGFDSLAWSVVALQVFGGLIVGMVVKYADNILKNFANALSVIFTVLGAMPLFGQYPSGWFIVGVALVSLSVFMYGKSAPQVSGVEGGLPGQLCWWQCLHRDSTNASC